MSDEKQRQMEAGAYAIARRNVAMAMAMQGRPDIGDARTYLPTNEQIAAATTATSATPTATASEPVIPATAAASPDDKPEAKKASWAATIARINGKEAVEAKPEADGNHGWTAVISRANAAAKAQLADASPDLPTVFASASPSKPKQASDADTEGAWRRAIDRANAERRA